MKKDYRVTIYLDVIEINLKADSASKAKKEALKRLAKKNPVNYIRKHWPDNKKEISVEEL